MKKVVSMLVLLGLSALPALAASANYQDASLLDVSCSKKAAANADAHTRSCALACAKSGYGIVTTDGHFLKFDANGNKEVLEELKASHKTDHLRVNVSGEVKGDTLAVSSVKLL